MPTLALVGRERGKDGQGKTELADHANRARMMARSLSFDNGRSCSSNHQCGRIPPEDTSRATQESRTVESRRSGSRIASRVCSVRRLFGRQLWGCRYASRPKFPPALHRSVSASKRRSVRSQWRVSIRRVPCMASAALAIRSASRSAARPATSVVNQKRTQSNASSPTS